MYRLALAAVLAGCTAAPTVDSKRPERILESVWMIRTPLGAGTGTVIRCAPEGSHYVVTLLTAKHVVKMKGIPLIMERDDQGHAGGVVKALHATLDVAVVEFRVSAPLPVADVFYGDLRVFQVVHGAGYAAFEFWVSSGLVSADDRATIHAAPGDSGGPVFDEDGRLVGVISHLNVMRHNRSMVFHHVHFVPVSKLRQWLAEHG